MAEKKPRRPEVPVLCDIDCDKLATHYRPYTTGKGVLYLCLEHKGKDDPVVMHLKTCGWSEDDAACGKPGEHEATQLIYDEWGVYPGDGYAYMYLCDEHWEEMQKKRPESF